MRSTSKKREFGGVKAEPSLHLQGARKVDILLVGLKVSDSTAGVVLSID